MFGRKGVSTKCYCVCESEYAVAGEPLNGACQYQIQTAQPSDRRLGASIKYLRDLHEKMESMI